VLVCGVGGLCCRWGGGFGVGVVRGGGGGLLGGEGGGSVVVSVGGQ